VSLLIDALKQAERAKLSQSEGGTPNPDASSSTPTPKGVLEPIVALPTLDLAPVERPETADLLGGAQKSEPKLGEVPSARPEPLPEQISQRRDDLPQTARESISRSGETRPGRAAPKLSPEAASKSAQQAAKGLFAAKQPSSAPKPRIGLLLAGGLGLLLLTAGAFYIWYALSFPPSLAVQSPPTPHPLSPALAPPPQSVPDTVLPSVPASPNVPTDQASGESATASSTDQKIAGDNNVQAAQPAVTEQPRRGRARTARLRRPAEASALSAVPGATAKALANNSALNETSTPDPLSPAVPGAGVPEPGAVDSTPAGNDPEGAVTAQMTAPDAPPAPISGDADPSSDAQPDERAASTQEKRKPARSKRKSAAVAGGIEIRRGEDNLAVIDPDLVGAYEALIAGDRATAKRLYDTVLQGDPFNLDAYLGLASIAASTGEIARAQRHYRRALELDPQNSAALAGLASVRGQSLGVPLESRLKNQLATEPASAQLHFALGNEYAAQARWAEAQQAYFGAYRLDARNADYAYNLAVSLDQLNQTKQARAYYQQALTLADERAANFNPVDVTARIQELQQ